MKERRILNTFRALDTSDGAGVRLKRALEEMVIEGVKTSVPPHQALLEQDDVKSGDYSIKWLEEWLQEREG